MAPTSRNAGVSGGEAHHLSQNGEHRSAAGRLHHAHRLEPAQSDDVDSGQRHRETGPGAASSRSWTRTTCPIAVYELIHVADRQPYTVGFGADTLLEKLEKRFSPIARPLATVRPGATIARAPTSPRSSSRKGRWCISSWSRNCDNGEPGRAWYHPMESGMVHARLGLDAHRDRHQPANHRVLECRTARPRQSARTLRSTPT